MRILLIFIVLLSQTLSAQESPKKDVGNYYWLEAGLGLNGLNPRGLSGGTNVNVAIGHHLFSGGIEDHGKSMCFCNAPAQRLSLAQFQYGYIEKHRFGFLYAKGGVGVGKFRYLVGAEEISSGFVAYTDYKYASKNRLIVPFEAGASVKLKVIMVGASVKTIIHKPAFMVIGLKIGLGDFM